MGMRVAAAAAAILLGAAAGGCLAQPPAPTHLVQTDLLKPVAPHVQVIPDQSVPVVPNVGFVVGTRGVMVIDTGLGPRNGAAVGEVAKRLAKGGQIWLVATHAHPEHDLGAQAFPAGTKLIRSRDQAGQEEADLRLAGVFQARSPVLAELLKGAAFRKADVTFDGRHELDLGGVRVVILAMRPAHTGGDTTVWVVEDKVLFSGDLAMKPQPSVAAPTATLAGWRKNLDVLAGLRPRIVVPSHGPMGDEGLIRGYRDYFAEVERRTAAVKAAGGDVEKAVAEVSAAMVARYPDKGRLSGAIRMAWGR